MTLSAAEKKRYDRHLRLKDVGHKGQVKFKNARVLVVGAGGLGCPALLYLTAAGVGTIGIIDFDDVDESNLQRQVVFDINDIGKNKAHAAKKKLSTQNPFINFIVSDQKLTNKNAIELCTDFDIILDGTDNFATRYLVNDACVLLGKPLIYGAINKFEGQVSVFNLNGGPTYRCLFPVPPEPGSVQSCSDVGVLGILPGIIGTHQANEALKIILGIGTTLSGRMLVYNALESSFTELALEKTTFQPAVSSEKELMEYNYDFFCGIEAGICNSISRIDFEALTEETMVLDVRENWEQPKVCNKKVLEIPLEKLQDNLNSIPSNEPVYVICQRGSRSASAISLLEKEYNYQNLINVSEGMIG